ncbi:unnamed protein product [Phytophthora lilii]|uniref:Unnamed protein product n=1 Tax=Phytophthora lilii TaxID=2077276 RepID=A0A9W6X7C0_9STRA|nr:unnamed protein product [Phytophthora lilii]
MSGIDEDMNPKLSNADNDAKRILTDYYTQLQSKDIEIPFRLSPVVKTKHGIKNHPTISKSGEAWKGLMGTIRWMDIFTVLLNGIEDIDRYLKDVQYPFPSSDEEATELVKEKKLNQQRRKILDANLKILNEVILKSAHDIKRQSSDEYDHDDNLQKLHDDSEASFQAYGEAQKRYEEAKKAVKGSNSKSARSTLKAATSAMKATKAVYLAKSKKYNQASHVKTDFEDFSNRQDERSINAVSGSGLKGRGLRGTGVAPLEGVVRRGRTYNLNEIQGLATPSAYIYRQLGSKSAGCRKRFHRMD